MNRKLNLPRRFGEPPIVALASVKAMIRQKHAAYAAGYCVAAARAPVVANHLAVKCVLESSYLDIDNKVAQVLPLQGSDSFCSQSRSAR